MPILFTSVVVITQGWDSQWCVCVGVCVCGGGEGLEPPLSKKKKDLIARKYTQHKNGYITSDYLFRISKQILLR